MDEEDRVKLILAEIGWTSSNEISITIAPDLTLAQSMMLSSALELMRMKLNDNIRDTFFNEEGDT